MAILSDIKDIITAYRDIQTTKTEVPIGTKSTISETPVQFQNRMFGDTRANTYELRSSKQFLDAYRGIRYVGFCTTLRADEISRVDYGIYQNDKEITGSKAAELFKYPYGKTQKNVRYRHLIRTVVNHLDLDGNFFALLDQRNKLARRKDTPSNFLVFNPANVDVIDEDGRVIRAYDTNAGTRISMYRVDGFEGGTINIPTEYMLHINAGSPYNMLRGMGVVQKNAPSLEVDRIQYLFDKSFFSTGPIVKMVITDPNDEVLSSDRPRVKAEIREEYGNEKNQIMMLPSGLKAEAINLNYSELEMANRLLSTKEDILMFFRIPRSKAGLETRFATKEQEQIEWESVLDTIFSFIEEPFSQVVEMVDGSGKYFMFKRRQTIDTDKAIKMNESGIKHGYMTPPEARENIGMAPDENCPKGYRSIMNVVPIEETSNNLGTESGKSAYGCSHEEVTGTKSDDQKMLIHKWAHKTKTKRIQPKIVEGLNEYFKALKERVLTGLEKDAGLYQSKGLNVGDLFNDAEELGQARKNAVKFFTSGLTISIDDVNGIFETTVETGTQSVEFRLVVEKLARNYTDKTLNTRKNEIKQILKQAMDDGMSMNDVKLAIESHFETLTKSEGWRVLRIARTESSNAWDAAAKIGYTELGVKKFDVIGCTAVEDTPEGQNCNRKNIPMAEWDTIVFHVNHTGTRVPA